MRARSPNQLPDDHKSVYGFDGKSPGRIESSLRGNEPVAFTQEREFIDAKAAAVWLGIPLRSFHQYVQKGFLPSYKLGRHRLFRKKELLSALSIHRTASRDEVLL